MPPNFLAINNVNSSLASLSGRVYEVQLRNEFEAEVKVFGELPHIIVTDCHLGDTCECHIVKGDTCDTFAGRARLLCGHFQ